MPYDATFDATQITPIKVGAAHPVGNKFPFTITNTVVKPTKDEKGGIFAIEFTSPQGSITKNYNLWIDSEAARRIANGELSWLCNCVGIFKIDFKNDGAALRGGVGLMDVNFQKGQEPSAERPNGGYVEIKAVYDKNGNEPNQVAQPQQQTQQPQQQQQQQQQQGFTPQANSGFNPNPSQQQQSQPQQSQGGGWNNQQQPQQQQNNGGGWQQVGMPQDAPWKS